MSSYVKIEAGVVVQRQPYPEAEFIEAPEGVVCGWLWDGEVFTPASPEPEPVPTSCTPAQGLVALYAVKGVTEDDVLAAIGQIADPVQQYTARIGLQRATSWERGSPTMQAMAALLGLTEQDLDDLYTLAVTVEV